MEYIYEVIFPKNYKPLPNGYRVILHEFTDHYREKFLEEKSPIFRSLFDARKWCFNHFIKNKFEKTI